MTTQEQSLAVSRFVVTKLMPKILKAMWLPVYRSKRPLEF